MRIGKDRIVASGEFADGDLTHQERESADRYIKTRAAIRRLAEREGFDPDNDNKLEDAITSITRRIDPEGAKASDKFAELHEKYRRSGRG